MSTIRNFICIYLCVWTLMYVYVCVFVVCGEGEWRVVDGAGKCERVWWHRVMTHKCDTAWMYTITHKKFSNKSSKNFSKNLQKFIQKFQKNLKKIKKILSYFGLFSKFFECFLRKKLFLFSLKPFFKDFFF